MEGLLSSVARVLWSLVLILFFAGCGGYHLAYLPGDERLLGEIEHSSPVESGSEVRATLRTGAIYEGVVTEVGDGNLEIALVDRETAVVSVAIDQLRSLEVYVDKSAVADLGAAALVVGGLVGGYYLVNSGGGSGDITWEATK